MGPGDKWLADNYPDHGYRIYAASGSTLIYELLRNSIRQICILPAFTCHSLSFAVLASGKQLIHVDVEKGSFFCSKNRLMNLIDRVGEQNVIVLVDHVFGYVCPWMEEIKVAFPKALLIEDCVRALGAKIGSRHVGSVGDFALLSLYKTIPGNDHGAVLLTRKPIPISLDGYNKCQLKSRLYGFPVVRKIYSLIKRRRVIRFKPQDTLSLRSSWKPDHRLPDSHVANRFDRHIRQLQVTIEKSDEARAHLAAGMTAIEGLELIAVAPGTHPGPYFLSALIGDGYDANAIVSTLHSKGVFLLRTWDVLPIHFHELKDTFEHWPVESLALSKRIVHISLPDYYHQKRRDALLGHLQKAVRASRQ